MKRDAIEKLEKWKNSPRRKPLIVEGARQVGKTWLVKEFASKHYKNLLYVNFEKNITLRNIFSLDFDPIRIMETLSNETHTEIIPGETLIFLDEIQEAENGITALKYFQEDTPDQHVIAAGSLLGIELHRNSSFPVGKVQFLQLYPMSFLEFLAAVGETGMVKLISEKDWQQINLFSAKLKERLRQYFFVGGMPEAIETFRLTASFEEVREVQNDILASYEFDFSKHAPNELVPRIRALWNSVPAQLSKENRKFLYGLVKEGARAREYENALQWLFDAGLLYKVSNVSAPRMPLKSYADPSAFKIFMLDVGLLGAMCRLSSSTIIDGNSIFTEFKGALTEQYVFQELLLKYEPFYFAKSNSRMEIDFLLQGEDNVVPVEVKAEENLKAKSLRLFVEEYKPLEAFRLSMSAYRQETWMTNLPLYAVETL